jgi:hypothetical protein
MQVTDKRIHQVKIGEEFCRNLCWILKGFSGLLPQEIIIKS